MYNESTFILLISLLSFFFFISLSLYFYNFWFRKRFTMLERLQGAYKVNIREEKDILESPFMERTIGYLARWLVATISRMTPQKALQAIEDKLNKAGNPYNLKASDFLALQLILGFIAFFTISWTLVFSAGFPVGGGITTGMAFAALAIYLPWFILACLATKRQGEIRRNLPDIMDLLVVSVEAGLAFDMALVKVVERFPGTVSLEFQQALREIQLGKPRKEALKNMVDRVNVVELTSLVNSVIQSDQLGVSLADVLRMQSDMIREKKQLWIEEQAMKAPVKLLFPLAFCIFPSMFIVLLGPAFINIMKSLK